MANCDTAAGLDRDPSTWGETLAGFNPFSRPSSRAEDPEQDKNLPPVNLKSVPKSWDPQAEAAQRDEDEVDSESYGGAGHDEEVEDEEAEDDFIGHVDVAMTGMGEPRMAI